MTNAALKERLTVLLTAVEAPGVVRVDIYHESFRSMIREAIIALSAMEGEVVERADLRLKMKDAVKNAAGKIGEVYSFGFDGAVCVWFGNYGVWYDKTGVAFGISAGEPSIVEVNGRPTAPPPQQED